MKDLIEFMDWTEVVTRSVNRFADSIAAPNTDDESREPDGPMDGPEPADEEER